MVNILRKINYKNLTIFGLLVLVVWLTFKTFQKPIYQDEGVFLAISKGILNGDFPYRDFFDHKPPGIYLLLLPAVIMFGSNILLLNIYIMIVNIVTAVIIYFSGEHLKKGSGLFASISYLLILVFFEGNYITAEPFIALFLSISIYLAIKEKKHALIGFLLSSALLIKQTVFLAAIPFIIYFKGDLKKVQRMLLGYIVPLITLVLAMLIIGFQESFSQIVLVNFSDYPREPLAKVVGGLWGAFAHTWPFWALSVIGLFTLSKRRKLLFGGIMVSLIPFFLVRHYSHYWVVILPIVSILGSLGFESIRENKRVVGFLLSVIILSVSLSSSIWYSWVSDNIDAPRQADQKNAAQYISSLEGEYVLCENQFTGFNYITNKKPLSKYLYVTEITESSGAENIIIEDLEANKDTIIVWPMNKNYPYAKSLQSYIEDNYRTIKEYEYLEMKVLVR